jgi:hypothetical protein
MKHFSLSCASLLIAACAFQSQVVHAQQSFLFPTCVDIDFNNNGVFPEDQDVIDFFDVLSGATCPTCDSIDINRNEVFPEDEDVTALFDALAGGYPSCAANGFTPVAEPPPVGTNNCSGGVGQHNLRTIYIAPDGNDITGCGTSEAPFATVRRALVGREVNGEWEGGITAYGPIHATIYLKPGTYTNLGFGSRVAGNVLNMGGVNASQPLTFAPAPGSTSRPVIQHPIGLQQDNLAHVRIQGLEVQGGISVGGAGVNHILIEDCKIVGGSFGVKVQSDLNPEDGITAADIFHVVVRRNIIQGQRASGTTSENYHAQGIYVAGATNLRIEENFFDDNGNRDTFCHGMYLVHKANTFREVVRNFVRDPGFAGIQARGGNFRVNHNVIFDSGNGLGIGHPMARDGQADDTPVSGEFNNNLIARLKPARWGIAIQNGLNASIDGNIVVSPRDNGVDRGYAIQWENDSFQAGSPLVNTTTLTNTRVVGCELDFNYSLGMGNPPIPTRVDVSNFSSVRGASGDALANCVISTAQPNWTALGSRALGAWNRVEHGTETYIDIARNCVD